MHRKLEIFLMKDMVAFTCSNDVIELWISEEPKMLVIQFLNSYQAKMDTLNIETSHFYMSQNH